MKLGRLNHIDVATPPIAESVAHYRQTMGANAITEPFDLPAEGVKVVFANPFVAASRGYIDEVIYPHSTRRRIALGLRKLANKSLENPWKKHDNLPL